MGYIGAMNEVRRLREVANVTQMSLANAAGTSQPTIAAYEADRKSPTLATLRRLARSVGLELSVQYHPPLTREERRSLFLHRAISRRLMEDPIHVLSKARRNLKRMQQRHSGMRSLLEEWRILLDRPVASLVEVLEDPGSHARELRHVTPFAGILDARDRARLYREFGEREGAA
jgi:transcriptional regulator with XRE-family HTH domain